MSRPGTRYRTVSRDSYVDESLFGPPSPRKATQRGGAKAHGNGGLAGFYSGSPTTPAAGGRKPKQQPETISVITKDGLRTVRVPDRTPKPQSVVISGTDFHRICISAQQRGDEEERKRQTRLAARHRREEEVAARKMHAHETTMRKTMQEPMSDLDREAAERYNRLREYAERHKEEEEEEIKKLNSAIMQAKIYAIRDAQLAEKEAIRAELQEEEAELDAMMEEERRRAVGVAERKQVELRTMRAQGGKEITKQIEEREHQKLIEQELREQETHAMLQQIEKQRESDRELAQQKREQATRLLAEVAKSNNEALAYKQELEELARLEDEKIAQYQKEKLRLEEEAEEQKKLVAAERELEIARLRALQEKSADTVAERHALQAKRQWEENERRFRRKQLDEVEKKKALLASVQAERDAQVQAKHHVMAVQVMQERDEFHRVLEAQQDLIRQEEDKVLEEMARRRGHILAVQQQIEEKEKQAILERKAFFEEGNKLDQEAAMRRQRLDEIKQRKLAELKAAGVHDKYCAPVQRLAASNRGTRKL